MRCAWGSLTRIPLSQRPSACFKFRALPAVIYYAAPLSTFSTIVRKRDASSINLLLAAANTMNGSAWLAYGLAMGSPFIWAPNGFGALLGIVQMALKAVFRQGSAEQSAS